MAVLLLIGALVVLTGALLVRGGIKQMRPDRSFEESGVATEADVLGLRWEQQRFGADATDVISRAFPMLRFTLPDGQTIETESRLGQSPPAGREGQRIPVVYDPADPTRAQPLSGGWVRSLLAVILCSIGAFFVLIGAGLVAIGIAVG